MIRPLIRPLWLFLPCLFWLMTACDQGPELCTSHYGNGQLKYEVPCAKGKFVGEYREYNRSGDLWVVKQYVDNVVEDTTKYYYSRTGELLKTVPMLHGEKHGEAREYYKTGVLKRVQLFDRGVPTGQDISYHPNGKGIQELRTYKNGKLDGPYRRETPEGNPLLDGLHSQGERQGTWRHYYPNGPIKGVFSYQSGMLEGDFRILKTDGIPYVSGAYRRGLVDGLLIIHTNSGGVMYGENWKAGTNLDYDQASQLPQSFEGDEAAFYDGFHKVRIFVSPDTIRIEQMPQS